MSQNKTRRQRRAAGVPVTRATPEQLADRVRQGKNAGPMASVPRRRRARSDRERAAIREASE